MFCVLQIYMFLLLASARRRSQHGVSWMARFLRPPTPRHSQLTLPSSNSKEAPPPVLQCVTCKGFLHPHGLPSRKVMDESLPLMTQVVSGTTICKTQKKRQEKSRDRFGDASIHGFVYSGHGTQPPRGTWQFQSSDPCLILGVVLLTRLRTANGYTLVWQPGASRWTGNPDKDKV